MQDFVHKQYEPLEKETSIGKPGATVNEVYPMCIACFNLDILGMASP